MKKRKTDRLTGPRLWIFLSLLASLAGTMTAESKTESPSFGIQMAMNVMIPMRDGIRLATDIYRPEGRGKFPVILMRTPYGSESTWYSQLGQYYSGKGYVLAVQDCRGKYDSEGDWYGQRSETKDGNDSIDWLAVQDWSTGNIGMLGNSYLGLVQWQVASVQNPHLKALIPIVAPVSLGREIAECSGSAKSPLGLSWLVTTDGRVNQNVGAYDWKNVFWHLPLLDIPRLLGRKIPFWAKSLNLEEGFWEEYLQSASEGKWAEKITAKGSYQDRYAKVRVPILQISGWFDGSSEFCFYNYEQIQRHSRSPQAKQNQHILIGPWSHFYTWSQHYSKTSRLGALDFGPDSLLDVDRLILAWFDRWLKEIPNGIEREAPIKYFVMGKNEWRKSQNWPVPGIQYRPFYLHSSGRAHLRLGDGILDEKIPAEEAPDHYIYNPANPTPALSSGENMALAASGPEDCRTIEEREDVLVYTSRILGDALEITGKVKVVLYISSDVPETEFIVRLTDVHPDGSSYPVYLTYAGAFNTRCLRASNQGFSGKNILRCEFELPPTSMAFLKGHRFRVHVCSSAFPLYRSLNTGGDFARETKMRIANQTIYHNRNHPSHIILPVSSE